MIFVVKYFFYNKAWFFLNVRKKYLKYYIFLSQTQPQIQKFYFFPHFITIFNPRIHPESKTNMPPQAIIRQKSKINHFSKKIIQLFWWAVYFYPNYNKLFTLN